MWYIALAPHFFVLINGISELDNLGILDIVKNKTLTCYNGIKGNGCGDCPACKLIKNGYLELKKLYNLLVYKK
ncbi:7-cyano-7-deazaguanine synthase [Tepidibacter aestuarii]|uniref:7-cyano-7-deazaguanine synthase n=1 Tax=Tepidibacter aestuarii TaxID=2925782 RepID=UPI002ED69ED8|nr:protein of unknown function [Tepidibacter aestuarii]